MTHVFDIEARRTALDGHFAHKARLHQVAQIVVRGGAGRAWVDAIDGFENFGGRGMPGMVHQERHHGMALGCTSQATALERSFD
ncbi:MAG TPA: hypothetical protein VMT67_11090 [Terriglobales bacterium]|nr:hypothetical protein [Terriglobales bacterium]